MRSAVGSSTLPRSLPWFAAAGDPAVDPVGGAEHCEQDERRRPVVGAEQEPDEQRVHSNRTTLMTFGTVSTRRVGATSVSGIVSRSVRVQVDRAVAVAQGGSGPPGASSDDLRADRRSRSPRACERRCRDRSAPSPDRGPPRRRPPPGGARPARRACGGSPSPRGSRPGSASAATIAGTSNFTSCVSTHTASRGPRVSADRREMPVGPVTDDLVGHREPCPCREHLAGVAHRDAVAEQLARPYEGAVKSTAPKMIIRGCGRERLDEHLDDLLACLAVRARSAACTVEPEASSPRASRATTRSRSGSPSEPSAAWSGADQELGADCPAPRSPSRARRARRRAARRAAPRRSEPDRRVISSPVEGSTKTWIVPPQVSPTANASSSEYPNETTPRARSPARTASASVTTAPSTQPPETEPATSPASFTAIVAPGIARAGAVETDDARDGDPLALGAPALDVVEQLLSSVLAITSTELLETPSRRQRVPSTNSSTYGSAAAIPRASGAYSGVAFSGFTHTIRCATRARRAISLGRAARDRRGPSRRRGSTTTAPRAMPRTPQRSLNARSPSPRRVPPDQSTTRARPRRQRGVGIAGRQLAREAGEAGAERERLDPAAADDGDVEEPQQRARVRLHRSAHVAEQHDPARAGRRRAERPPHGLAAGAQRAAHRAAEVGAAARGARRPVPAGAAQRAGEAQVGHEPLRLGVLVGRVRRRSRGGAAPRPGSSGRGAIGPRPPSVVVRRRRRRGVVAARRRTRSRSR